MSTTVLGDFQTGGRIMYFSTKASISKSYIENTSKEPRETGIR